MSDDNGRTLCMDCIHDPESCGHLPVIFGVTDCDFFEDKDDDLIEEDFEEDDDLEEDDEDLEYDEDVL